MISNQKLSFEDLPDEVSRLNDKIDRLESLLTNNSNPPQSEEETLMDSRELSEFLDVSKVTIHKWRKQGRIPFIRIGTRIRFQKKDVLNSLEQCKKYSRYD